MDQTEKQPVIPIQTLQGAVVSHLRKLILSGELAPGQRLVQDELSELLSVSRTPIREALNRLAMEGLVTISNYKGASVARFSPADMIEVYSIRAGLESYAAYLAAQCITGEELDQLEELMLEMGAAFRQEDFEHLLESHHQFHAGIYAAAKRQSLYDMVMRYLNLSNVYQRMALSMGRGAKDPIVEHLGILDTLRKRDGEMICRLMREHLEMTLEELLQLFNDKESTTKQPD